MTGDIYEGKPVEQDPRQVLKRLIADAATAGYDMKSGVECEFFLISSDGSTVSDAADQQAKPCYDQLALMRRYEIVAEICDSMITLGWRPYQNDHEDANGQFEMNWEFTNALVTADRHAFFKFMVKSIAEKHGLRATFMPKPFGNLTGSGCHSTCRCGKAPRTYSRIRTANWGCHVQHTISLEVLCIRRKGSARSPIRAVNSYKRINAPRTLSGATWSPNTVTYSGNNRTHMIRIPDSGRFEFRLPDGAANPYLLQAAVWQRVSTGSEITRSGKASRYQHVLRW